MSAALNHHAAIALQRAADRVGELLSADFSREAILLRLDSIRYTLEREAREYEQIAAADYIAQGCQMLTDRDPGSEYGAGTVCEGVPV